LNEKAANRVWLAASDERVPLDPPSLAVVNQRPVLTMRNSRCRCDNAGRDLCR